MGWLQRRRDRKAAQAEHAAHQKRVDYERRYRPSASSSVAATPTPVVVPDPVSAGLLYGTGVYGGLHSHSDTTFDDRQDPQPDAPAQPESDYSTSGYDSSDYSTRGAEQDSTYSTQGSLDSSDYSSSGYDSGSSSSSYDSSSSSSSYDSGSSSYDSGSSSFDSGSSSF